MIFTIFLRKQKEKAFIILIENNILMTENRGLDLMDET